MNYYFFMLFLILCPILYSQQSIENVSIQIEPEKVVFLESESKKITVTLQNTSSVPLSIEMAKNSMYNSIVEAYDDLKLPVPFSTEFYYLRLNNTVAIQANGNIGYTTMSIEQGKDYSFDILLDNYIDFRSTGVFTIILRFLPSPFNNKNIQIVSRPILISVLKDTAFLENTFQDEFGNDNTNEGRISQTFFYPENTVEKALQYAMHTNWDGFFSTVDLYSFYLNIIQNSRHFTTLDYHQQRQKLLTFIDTIADQEDYIFLTENTTFSIEEIRRTSKKAIVTSIVSKIYKNQRKEIRNYTFFLEKKANSWKIINIDTTNVGIERIGVVQKNQDLPANLDYLIPADFIEAE